MSADGISASTPVDRIERVGLPTWAHLGSNAAGSTSAEDPAWGWAIPWVQRACAAPSQDGRWPAAPRAGSELEAATGYWEALLHLLLYSFGWSRPDRGLRWWYDAGHPTDDRRLRLTADTYLADGRLDWFAAWLWTTPLPLLGQHGLHGMVGNVGNGDAIEDVDRDWCEAQERAAITSGVPAPIGGGSDPLHLEVHSQGPLEKSDAPVELRTSRSGDHFAVLLLDGAVGWYRSLVEHWETLPGVVHRSWHVDVVIKPVGWIGTYRRSRETGRWYSGAGRYHRLGC